MSQYVVSTSGKILDSRKKEYLVYARSPEEAELLARRTFADEYCLVNPLVETSAKRRMSWKVICAYLTLAVPVLLSFVDWKIGHDTISIAPTLRSTLLAVILYSAFVMRFKGLRRIFYVIDLIFLVLVVLLLSSFVSILIIEYEIPLFGFRIDSYVILIGAAVLAWLGVRLISSFTFLTVFLLAMVNMSRLSQSMGNIWGPVYILFSFIGLCMYLACEPAARETIYAVQHFTRKRVRSMHEDLTGGGNW